MDNNLRYLNDTQLANASYIYTFFTELGWTQEAVAAIIGNMHAESAITPEMEERGGGGGYGLVQWTPRSKLTDWALAMGMDETSIETQLARIMWEFDNGTQYYATASYPLTFKQFVKSSETPAYLAQAFMYNYERPASLDQPHRSNYATSWYEYFTENTQSQPTIDEMKLNSDGTYTVKKGDTLSKIALNFNTTVDNLVELNKIKDKNIISIGAILKIVAPIVEKEKSETVEMKKNADGTYTVKKGDTLYSIAQNFKTTVADLITLNSLKDANSLSIGQILMLVKPVETIASNKVEVKNPVVDKFSYVVVAGDTLYKIALANSTTVEALQKLNGIKNVDLLVVGQVLKIKEDSVQNVSSSVKTYTVKSGDTLGKIATSFNVAVADLQKWNSIANINVIFPGQILNLQAPKVAKTYTVKAGDTLGVIAKNNNTTVDVLQKLNDIKNINLIVIGQVLILP